jgi:hypothetical protein
MAASADRTRWVDLALALVPSPVEARLRQAYAYTLPAREMRVPVARLHGVTRADGRAATMLVAGAEHWSQYLPGRFFAGAPRRELIGHAPMWALPRRLRPLRATVDITVVRADQLSARAFFDDDYLSVPEWVGLRLPLPVDVAALARESTSVVEDLRKTRRNRLTVDISRDPADCAAFYHRMFVPYTLDRHGSDAYLKSYPSMQRSFRHGGILWLRHEGEPVAGNVFEIHGSTMILTAIGVVDGDIDWRKRGALASLYVNMIAHAHRCGCTMIDMRGARPSLSDGLFRYKAKWGTEIYDMTQNPYSALVHWNRLDGAVAAFLADTPLVFRDGGGLSGLAVAGEPGPWTPATLQHTRRQLWIAGLDRLCLVGNAARDADTVVPTGTRLVDHDAVRDAGPRALAALLDSTA